MLLKVDILVPKYPSTTEDEAPARVILTVQRTANLRLYVASILKATRVSRSI